MKLPSEFEGALFQNVQGFLAKYFPDAIRKANSPNPLDKNRSAHQPIPLVPRESLLRWLSQLEPEREEAGGRRFLPHDFNPSHGGAGIALVATAEPPSGHVTNEAEVLVLGTLQDEVEAEPGDNFLAFCESIVRVFSRRPHRLFLHAFRIIGSFFEPWIFDRAGGYCAPAIDIRAHPNLFRALMLEYTYMDQDSLGLNRLVYEKNPTTLVQLTDSDSHGGGTFAINSSAIALPDDLVGPGTTCFKGSTVVPPRRSVVVKFSWTSGMSQGEWKLLQRTMAKNVHGVVRLEAYQVLLNTASLRQGLTFEEPFNFEKAYGVPEHLSANASLERLQTAESLQSTTDKTGSGDKASAFENLILECTVTSPYGRPLDTFCSPSELLRVLHDVVEALKSLYLDAGILHRDISTQNIIIASSERNSSAATGMLIDLNLALDLADPSNENSMIGSEGFMAIGILGGDDHTYRHDLESVFYIFLWMAICHDGTSSAHIPDNSRLHSWMGTSWFEIFTHKRADMQPLVFSDWIHQEFREAFVPYLPLTIQLHTLLFPIRNGKIDIKTDMTDSATRQLYESISAALAASYDSDMTSIGLPSRLQ